MNMIIKAAADAAQSSQESGSFMSTNDLHQLGLTVLYSGVGLVVFALALFIVVKVAPFSVRKEIEEDQNTSLGIIIGSIMIGLALIIAAAISSPS